jgi:hypothetical protein
MAKPIHVKTYMPPLAEFIRYLGKIWDNKIHANGGPFLKQLKNVLDKQAQKLMRHPLASGAFNAFKAAETALYAARWPSPGSVVSVAAYRALKYQETLSDLLPIKFEVAKVVEGREGAITQMIEEAQLPGRYCLSKHGLTAISTRVASMIGLPAFAPLRAASPHALHGPARAARPR